MATVSYTPNDPLASGGPPTRSTAVQNYPPGDIAKFDVQPSAAPGKYNPHTPEFQFWQAKLALISGLRAFRQVDRKYLRRWFGDQRELPVFTDAGDDLNAFYDRASLQFFSHSFNGNTVNSAESVDVVTHEQGHAFLDAIRPDFFEVPFIESGRSTRRSAIARRSSPSRTRRSAMRSSSPHRTCRGTTSSRVWRRPSVTRSPASSGRATLTSGAASRAQHLHVELTRHAAAERAADQLSGEVRLRARLRRGVLRHHPQHLHQRGQAQPAGAAQGIAHRRPAPPCGHPDRSRRTEHVRRRRPADAAGRRHEEQRGQRAGHQGCLRGAWHDPDGAGDVPAGAVAEARSGRRQDGAAPPDGRPPRTKVEVTPVDGDLHAGIAHVAAYRPLQLDGDGLAGVRVMVPGVARVSTRRGGRRSPASLAM